MVSKQPSNYTNTNNLQDIINDDKSMAINVLLQFRNKVGQMCYILQCLVYTRMQITLAHIIVGESETRLNVILIIKQIDLSMK